jgi:thiamine-monophosphate kinase
MTRSLPTVADIGEEALIGRIARLVGRVPKGTLGIGDDAALIPAGRGRLLLTTDALVEGTHFLRTWFRPEEVGLKALTSNISDAAAMGGRPTHAVVSLILPSRTPVESVERLYRGVRRAAAKEDLTVVGGNLARGKAISVTLALLGSFPRGEPVLRSGAHPGDRLFVSGQPGLAYLGRKLLARSARGRRADLWDPPASREPEWRSRLGRKSVWAGRALARFLRPQPRVQTARDLRHFRPTSMIDVSDGLATDLEHLAQAGARLLVRPERLPSAPGFRRLAEELGETGASAALRGGDDYELLVTVPARAARSLGSRAVVGGVPLIEIGEVLRGPPGVYVDAPGGVAPLPPAGYRHFGRSW